VNLRSTKPFPGERKDAVSIPNEDAGDGQKVEKSDGDDKETTTVETTESTPSSETNATETEKAAKTEEQESETGKEKAETEKKDDDSDERVGEEEAAKLDRNVTERTVTDSDSDNDEDDVDSSHTDDTQSATKVSAMFQKILALGKQSGEAVVKLGSEGEDQNGKHMFKRAPVQCPT
jgi:hypothetical protein